MGLGLAVAYVLSQDKNQIQTLIETLTGPTERLLAALARWQCKVRDREERQRPLVLVPPGVTASRAADPHGFRIHRFGRLGPGRFNFD